MKKFIQHSLSPAKVSSIEINESNKCATAYVANDQLSLAIGKQGQNVRLAAKLTGWKIDVVEKKEEAEEAAEPKTEKGEEQESKADTKDEETKSSDEKAINEKPVKAEKKSKEKKSKKK